jgi:hypothetical protein
MLQFKAEFNTSPICSTYKSFPKKRGDDKLVANCGPCLRTVGVEYFYPFSFFLTTGWRTVLQYISNGRPTGRELSAPEILSSMLGYNDVLRPSLWLTINFSESMDIVHHNYGVDGTQEERFASHRLIMYSSPSFAFWGMNTLFRDPSSLPFIFVSIEVQGRGLAHWYLIVMCDVRHMAPYER